MGQVFAAYDEQLDRRVAVKLLRQTEAEAGTHLHRVMREAQAMARVAHENVVHVYEVGEIGGQIFIAMEFIDGTTLTTWQKQKGRTWQELLSVYEQAGQGLSAAHQTGLVHRDFKPDNVLVDRTGRARVVDFGLARLQGDTSVSGTFPTSSPQSALQSPLTRDGAIAGTPGYMSPEQVRGAALDARSDQFSFSVALYEALYCRAPFASQDLVDALNPGLPRPPPADSAVPIEVFTALSRGMATEPSKRFSSIAELLEALASTRASQIGAVETLRRSLTVILIPALLLCSIVIALKGVRSILRLEALIGFMAFSFTGTAILGWFLRQTFRTNAFLRELIIRYLCFSGTLFCLRSLGLFLHLDMQTFIPIDLVVAGGLTAGYAYPHMPLMWATVGSFELAAAAAVLWPEYGSLIINLAYAVFAFSLYYQWARSARGRGAKKPSGVRPGPREYEAANHSE